MTKLWLKHSELGAAASGGGAVGAQSMDLQVRAWRYAFP